MSLKSRRKSVASGLHKFVPYFTFSFCRRRDCRNVEGKQISRGRNGLLLTPDLKHCCLMYKMTAVMIPALAHSLSPHVSVTAMWNWSRRTSGRGHSSRRAHRGGSHVSLYVFYFASFHGWLVFSGRVRSRWSAGSNPARDNRQFYFYSITSNYCTIEPKTYFDL